MKRGSLLYVFFAVLLIVGIIFENKISLVLTNINSGILWEFMIWVSYLGTSLVVLVFMTSLFMWREKRVHWIFPLWISVIISVALVYGLKFMFMRARPYEILDLTRYVVDSFPSFPSSHAAGVFSTLPILDKEFPRFKWFWIGFSLLVGFSRIYLGAHYLSDVVVGALVGFLVGKIIVKNHKWFSFEGTKKTEKARRKIRK